MVIRAPRCARLVTATVIGLALVGPGGVIGLGPLAAQPTPVVSGSVRTRVDSEALLVTRGMVRWGPSRWFVLSESEVALQEEVDAPAGYRHRRVTLRSPLENAATVVGVEAGPLILGPIRGRGLYHRLLDPTAGGVNWTALTERSRFVPALDPGDTDRQGVALCLDGSHGSIRFPAAFSTWLLEREGRYRLHGWDGWFAPLPDERLGRIGVAAVTVNLMEDRAPGPDETGWVYQIPPSREARSRRQALYWDYDTSRRESPSTPGRNLSPTALAEVWRHREGYRAPRFAGNVRVALGPDELRVTGRLGGSEAGFRTVENTRPRNSRLAIAEVSHRSVHDPVILEGAIRGTRSASWEEEQPGSARTATVVSFTARRIRLPWFPVLEQVGLIGTIQRYRRADGRVHFRSANDTVRMRFGGAVDTDDRWSVSGDVRLLPRARGTSRTILIGVSGRLLYEPAAGRYVWNGAGELSLPIGRHWRLACRVRVEEEQWSGAVSLEFVW